MPLALDLISTLVNGSIVPVATTDLAIFPRSTVASLEGSMTWFGRRAAVSPSAPVASRAAEPIHIQRRRFPLLLWLLAMFPSQPRCANAPSAFITQPAGNLFPRLDGRK